MGVRWVLPPRGNKTVPAPMDASNCSVRPIFPQVFRSLATCATCSAKGRLSATSPAGSEMRTVMLFGAPAESTKARDKSTIACPCQSNTSRGSAVISATTVASRFSFLQAVANMSQFSRAMTQAIRSCDSEMANSVPFKPSYFLGTASKFT